MTPVRARAGGSLGLGRVVAGIDPGLARTGYGFIAAEGERCRVLESGTIVTDSHLPEAERLRVLYAQLLGRFRRLRPELVVVERLFFNRNARSALSVGQARGVALLAAARAGVRVVEVSPQQAKLAVSGQGAGTKEQVGFMVRALLKLQGSPGPDEADALAVALWGALSGGSLP